MPKKTHNIMRVSGRLPVSYSVFMRFEKEFYFENVIKTESKETIFYCTLKYITDYLNDNPSATNSKILSKVKKLFKAYKITKWVDSQVNSWIDFIRDSLIIYQDTISQEQQDTIGAVLT
jgi:hypothetical protein